MIHLYLHSNASLSQAFGGIPSFRVAHEIHVLALARQWWAEIMLIMTWKTVPSCLVLALSWLGGVVPVFLPSRPFARLVWWISEAFMDGRMPCMRLGVGSRGVRNPKKNNFPMNMAGASHPWFPKQSSNSRVWACQNPRAPACGGEAPGATQAACTRTGHGCGFLWSGYN
jgi:hypothetical protein